VFFSGGQLVASNDFSYCILVKCQRGIIAGLAEMCNNHRDIVSSEIREFLTVFETCDAKI